MSSLDYLELCRLCLVKDNVSLPIFEDEGDERQIYFKISSCLPVKVLREDKLPKKICDECGYKVELLYQFWNTSVNAEKQLLQWLGEVGGLEEKQDFVTAVLDPSALKQDRSGNTRLDGNVLQVSGQGNIDINMIDNMSIITIPAGSEQQFTTVPMDTSVVQAVAGPSTQVTHEQLVQSQADVSQIVGEESEEDNYDDGCDNDDGMTVKEETEEDHNEQSTFANVSLPCDEAGPSGLQQSELTAQTADGDPKSGIMTEADVVEDVELNELKLFDYDHLLKFADDDDDADNEDHEETNAENRSKADAEEGDVQHPEPLQSLLVRTASGSLHRFFPCSQCDQVFGSVKQCLTHIIKSHPESRRYRVAYRCKTCQKLFRSKSSCERHVQSEHKCQQRDQLTCRYCAFSSPSPSYLKKHERSHIDDFQIRCELCNKGFSSRALLDRHLLSHTGAKPFVCEICGACYADKRSLQMHATIHDPAGRPKKYNCDLCDYSSFWKNAVKTHMKIHTGAKVICDECGQPVASNYYLKVHKRIHTDEKPFTCNVCDKKFRQMKNLVVHQRTHSKIKPYKCTVCNKSFSQNVWLKKHKCTPTT